MKADGRSLRAVLVLGSSLLLVGCERAPASQTASSGTGASDQSVVAKVGEREITLEEVDQRALAGNMAAFQQLYEVRRQALEQILAEALLEQEAKEQGITTEELEAREIQSKVTGVTDQEVQAFYEQNRNRLGGQTLEQIGGQIREYLVALNEATARESYLATLRAKAHVEVSLDPPRVPIQVAEGERVKGPADAPVTIVEYSDFQ